MTSKPPTDQASISLIIAEHQTFVAACTTPTRSSTQPTTKPPGRASRSAASSPSGPSSP